ncbi:ATP-binding protein [Flavonifractor sp. An92]|uniref:Mrp/NBP35 family ATP-binding protein n=1 Tax=Flavonifractor sp. An92 TaxID=1965666 RepID=UPI000B39F68C|nr:MULTISPECIES: Mrp/NBP35 family ATP-binding protein [unclassified Flavonifractor]OUN04197.1 ATP-binding protein [Flavonifractor sp. An92]OUQ21624.1 ATP-binding protein [Flavonifractor sp. An135]
MSECTHDCSTCGQSCSERTEPQSFEAKPHELSHIKKVIAVVSGKGGVGKSLVTSSLAAAMHKRGKKVGILDADITGPSIPKSFGIHERALGSELGIYPVESKGGIQVMSLNVLTDNETDPVIWRGPVIAGAVKQFWTDVIWGDVDYLFVDMPPGTGDVPLTVFQSLPVDGIVVVTSPQDLVSMIVTKAVKMAEMMHIPVLGLVENYSYFQCPDCGKQHHIFGESHIDEVAQAHGLKVLARLPIDPGLAAACDRGEIELYEPNYLADVAAQLDAE